MEFGSVVLLFAIFTPLKFELHPCKSSNRSLKYPDGTVVMQSKNHIAYGLSMNFLWFIGVFKAHLCNKPAASPEDDKNQR